MNAEEWRQIDRIFHEALERKPSDRVRYLKEECSSNPSLREEVEGLLASFEQATDFLETGGAKTASSPVASLTAGTRLGPYEILGAVGAGGMGEVYRAHDLRLQRDVAVKVLQRVASDGVAWASIQREARAASTLSHPNICTVHDVGEAEGQPYLVMELLEGVTLSAHIGEQPLETSTALSIAFQIAEALESAHVKGIIHRDIKSANIMINSRGQAKILDFGLAKHIDVPRDQAPTLDGSSAGGLRGTPAYLPPEVLEGVAADARGDLWALGVVLYQMLAGRLPFTGATVYEVSSAILKDPPPPLPSSVPAGVRKLVQRCLAKRPEERFQTAGEVRTALEELRTPAGVTKGISRRTWLLTTGGLALLGAGAAAGLQRLAQRDSWEDILASVTAQPLTDFDGDEFAAAISPDGKSAAYVRDLGGQMDAWVSPIDAAATPSNLTNGKYIVASSARNSRGVFFKDSGEVLFFHNATPNPTLAYVVPAVGEAPRLFVAASSPAWSPVDGRMVFHTTKGDPILVANNDGSDPVEVFRPEPGVHCHFPIWSPDGRYIYFVMGIPATEEMDIWRIGVSPKGGAPSRTSGPTRITSHNARVTFPDWLDSRTLIYTAMAQDSAAQWLYWMDVDDRIANRAFTSLEEQYLSVAISASPPRRLIVTKATPVAALHTLSLSDQIHTWKDAQPFEALKGLNARVLSPRYAPVSEAGDPDYLLFLSSKGGRDGLWKLENGTRSVLWPESEGGIVSPPAISRDGRQICFSYRKEGRSGLYVMNHDRRGMRALADSLDVRGAASWSPDGKFIVVAANQKDQGTRVFKVPLDPGSSPVPLVDDLSYDPQWAPDGTFILYSVPGEGATTVLKAVTSNREDVPLPPMDELRGNPGISYRFVPGRKTIIALVSNKDTGRQGFNSVDLETGKMRQLAELETGASFRDFDVSRDGKSIIFDRVKNNANIWWANLSK